MPYFEGVSVGKGSKRRTIHYIFSLTAGDGSFNVRIHPRGGRGIEGEGRGSWTCCSRLSLLDLIGG